MDVSQTARTEEPPDCLALYPGVKQVMEQAVAQAKRLHHDYIGTEHILLSFLATNDATKLLKQAGIDAEAARQHVLELLTPA